MMCHSSGQWVDSSYVMPVSKLDAQAVGSAITYARRYALAAMVGVAPEDDDGNNAAKNPPKPQSKSQPKPEPKQKTITADQATFINDLLRETDTSTALYLQWIGSDIKTVNDIPASVYKNAVEKLEQKKAKLEEAIQ